MSQETFDLIGKIAEAKHKNIISEAEAEHLLKLVARGHKQELNRVYEALTGSAL